MRDSLQVVMDCLDAEGEGISLEAWIELLEEVIGDAEIRLEAARMDLKG